MDMNWLLIWVVTASCALTGFQLLKQGRRGWPRVLLPIGIAGVLLVAWLIHPETAGYWAGLAWAIFLLIPGIIHSRIERLLAKRKYTTVRRLSQLIAVLHPFPDSRYPVQLFRALELIQSRQTQQAASLLDKLAANANPMGRMAVVLRTRLSGDWSGYLQWFRSHRPEQFSVNEPLVLDCFIQALGETGQRDAMVRSYAQLVAPRASVLPEYPLNLTRAKVAAFLGATETVGEIFAGPLQELPPEHARFWTATAELVAGNEQEGRSLLQRLEGDGDSLMMAAVERRLSASPKSLTEEPLDALGRDILHEIRHQLDRTSALAAERPRAHAKPWAIWSIAAVLALVFLMEIPGGTTNHENLTRMGAMLIPVDQRQGEWWRVITAAFLHFGFIHFAVNTLGLLIFGSRLERAWGGLPTVAAYLLSAIGSIALAPFFMSDELISLVGASGGVMGLIGSLLADTSIMLFRGRSRALSREFQLLAMVVILQLVFDANTPQVASAAHLLGLAIGIAFGLFWHAVQFLLRSRRLARTDRRDADSNPEISADAVDEYA